MLSQRRRLNLDDNRVWVSAITGFADSFWMYATRPVGISGGNGAERFVELLDEVGFDILRILWSAPGIPSYVRAERCTVLVSRPVRLVVVFEGVKDVPLVLYHAFAQVPRLADIEDGRSAPWIGKHSAGRAQYVRSPCFRKLVFVIVLV